MMKTKSISSILFIILLTGFIMSCSTSKIITTESGSKIDKRLVGTWKGCENGQQYKDVMTCWIMERKDDGTFVLDVSSHMENEVSVGNDNGTWWVENDKFFELHNNSNKTDIYKYKVIKKDDIYFESLKMNGNITGDNYMFNDYKVGSKKEKELPNYRDGSSFEKAIKVGSIPEEYKYVKNNCKHCRLVQQALIYDKKIPFDVIEMERPDGTTVSYYFDISSFYGKGF